MCFLRGTTSRNKDAAVWFVPFGGEPGPLKGRNEGEVQEDYAPKTKQEQVLLIY